eukprot:scaffold3498_cov176-Amphora_coffeaeformis.AAC.10
MMHIPIQNRNVPCASVIKASRISVVTPEELKRTPSSVLSNKDMKTILLAYRLVMYSRSSLPSSMAHARWRRNMEK